MFFYLHKNVYYTIYVNVYILIIVYFYVCRCNMNGKNIKIRWSRKNYAKKQSTISPTNDEEMRHGCSSSYENSWTDEWKSI